MSTSAQSVNPSVSTSSTPRSLPPRARVRGLDGVRALAVFMVLAYHLLPGALPGGKVGVDAFFVISGFLITSLLVDERRRTGSTNLRRFWVRRLRRIVPALLSTIVVTVSLAAWPGGDVLLGIRRQVLGAIGLVYNWVEIFAGSSYFDQAQPSLLTNVWSLAVEEQFYLVWPLLLLLLLGRADSRWRRYLACGAAVVLTAASVWLSLTLAARGADPSRLYLGTDTHAYGLMAGSALALLHGHVLDPTRVTTPLLERARAVVSWAGLVGLVLIAALTSDQMPGGTRTTTWVLAGASACTVALLQGLTPEVAGPALALSPGSWLPALLETAPLRWLGTRSYGLYLWHWPLWVLAFYVVPPTAPQALVALGVTVVSVFFAELSFRYFETPIRRMGVRAWVRSVTRTRLRLSLSGGLGVASVLLLGAALALQPAQSTAEAAIQRGAQALASATPTASRPAETPTPEQTPTTAAPEPLTGDQVSLVGDSVSLASAPALEASLPGIAIDAQVSRSFYAGLETLQAMDAEYGSRPYVVVALATNGEVLGDQIQALLDYLGPGRKLVLVTGFGPARTTWIPGANQTIRDFAAAHPDQVDVAGWDRAIAERMELLAQDQVHPTAEGCDVYAQVVVDALNALNV